MSHFVFFFSNVDLLDVYVSMFIIYVLLYIYILFLGGGCLCGWVHVYAFKPRTYVTKNEIKNMLKF